MVTRDLDYTNPNLHYSFDLIQSNLFTKNPDNFINVLGIEQLQTIGNVFLLDVFLSADNVVEPHYHSNASELIYCITGETTASLINPSTNELKSFNIKPQQVVTVPQGWWHYFTANTDNTHLLEIFDTPKLDTIQGSDVLRLTSPKVFAHTYCMEEDQIENALAPIKDTVIIGPPSDCHKGKKPSGYDPAYVNHTYQTGSNYQVFPGPPYYGPMPNAHNLNYPHPHQGWGK